MNDLIDVLICVYNGETTIESSVDSIRHQSHRNLCIHIVDDGSTDRTPEILSILATHDNRISIHTQPNRGIADAANHGLSFCTAEWVARHDADDLAYPNRLETQLAYLKSNPDCVAVSAAVRHVNGEGLPTGSTGRLPQPGKGDAAAIPAREPYLIHPVLMVRRVALENVGRYRHFYSAEDSDLYWRLLDQGRLHNLPDVLCDYRLHQDSVSSSSLHNGRLLSVNSQLAAVSFKRRQSGRADLTFDKSQIRLLRNSQSLEQMVVAASLDLCQDERPGFAAAVSAKLLELTAYRPYELANEDCVFIGRTLAAYYPRIPERSNRKLVKRMLSGAAARLVHGGQISSARALFDSRWFAGFVWRLAVRYALPAAFRTSFRRAIGNNEASK